MSKVTKYSEVVEVHTTKLVPGGQALGELPDGRKVFIWGALPDELVRIEIIKQKRTYCEAIAETIIKPSADRVVPFELNYLATSPWQLMTFEAENRYKKDITEELLQQHKVEVPAIVGTTHDAREWHYRNKMEYSFWGDEAGLHLALHGRGSHGKQIVSGSKLAMREVDLAATTICILLDKNNIRAGDLKTIVVRSTQSGLVAASLFVKNESFPKLQLPEDLSGLRIYYSNPKSPASVPTKLLDELGDCTLQDNLLGKAFAYDSDSFFQVNVPVFELALERIKEHCKGDELTDMYAGVGSIGLSVATQKVDLIELDPATVSMARVNARALNSRAQVIEASTEKVLEYITHDRPVIFDPPRAGLHERVVDRLLETKPSMIIYLSCNPATQARDLARLRLSYKIEYLEVFNFFPRTPHTEALAVLVLR